jgi:hypothetical protein
MNNKQNFFLILIVSLIIIAARLIPHVPNFSPLAAVILFSTMLAKDKKYLIMPFVALLVSDFFLGFYHLGIMLSVYGSFTLILLLGYWVKKYKNITNLITATLGAGLLFFLVTNFAVWYFGTWYAHDFSGLMLSYMMAIPFFKQTILSNLLYTGLLFGVYETVQLLVKQKSIVTNK